MTDRFQRAFALLKVHEGGFVNHPKDPGGATNKGVTQRVYDASRRRWGLAPRSVREITDDEVERIYRVQYWDAVRADELPPGVAYTVFDAAVNSGPGQAAKWLQAEVGAAQDGIVGTLTLAAVETHSPVNLIRGYNARRLAFMKRLPHWPTFKNGWTSRVHEVTDQSVEWAVGRDPAPSRVDVAQPKAEGQERVTETVKDVLKDPRGWGGLAGVSGGLFALAQESGPIQWAIAAAIVVGVLGLLVVALRARG